MTVVTMVINVLAALVITLSLVYFLWVTFAGFHELRRRRLTVGVQGDATYGRPFVDEPATFDTYVLIPCLNEEAVIGATVAALNGGRRNTTIVVDDGSDDRTAAIAEDAGDSSTIVHRRTAPHARQGKGEALNDAFQLVRKLVAERGQDPSRVLVVVMDADGRLSDGAFREILPVFEDPEVGGLQVAVRIRNRETNFLTRFQDFQFWSLAALAQYGRRKTGTVSLGGNGQVTRFTALDRIGDKPWSSSLTEDLDLAITLAQEGWALETVPTASVDQQGVTELRRLFVQRRRWYQGHMMTTKRLGEIWSNPRLTNVRALELSAYLLVPWLFDLPWSLLWHWNIVQTLLRLDAIFAYVDGFLSLCIGLLVGYVLAFGPTILSVVVFLRRDRRHSLISALVLGHSFLVMNYLAFACAWGALWRIITGKRGWDKTKRVAEGAAPPALEAQEAASS
ncbi:glycosyltransferase [Leifsonia sp. 22587]|uniref:glycosyltransferase n=1 Tax=Leifsonia sp. 22587 TaxID=3453946 RepID=UPI003F826B4F